MQALKRGAALILGAGLAMAVPAAQAQTQDMSLLVLSKGAQTVAVVDPVTREVRGRIPSGPDPHEVVASTDGRTAYISNYNGGVNRISVVDLSTMQARDPIDLGALRAPHGVAFAGGKLWFTAEGSKVVGSYDPATSAVDWVLGTGQDRTHMIYVFDDLQRMVTTNVTSATVTFIERSAGRGRRGAPPAGRGAGGRGGRGGGGDWTETQIPVGGGAEGFDVTPDGREIWVANAQDGTISIIDVAGKRVTATLQANVGGANRLKFTPDGKYALVSSLRDGNLAVFDVAGRTESRRVPIGSGAAGVEVHPDGRFAYVACTPDGYVAVVDLTSWTVAGRIDAGPQPDGLAWAVRR